MTERLICSNGVPGVVLVVRVYAYDNFQFSLSVNFLEWMEGADDEEGPSPKIARVGSVKSDTSEKSVMSQVGSR